MTLEPAKNRYVAHMRAIRAIQVSALGPAALPNVSIR